MRTMMFMSRMFGMIVLMVGVLLAVFVLLDILRIGPNARGFLIGSNLWQELKAIAEALF
ncbi:hypothetical protein [Paragemmobacter straminiformis]|uniref:Uncharacterized protein n=1 Tax=Paragemmobacter straminiformis TaxID=2045119 RepID=A0A842I5Z6_9RHOB|nr:hypothetical protein [Gemmobacter straminiformis]MBC2835001.1 hypothetical protein [Gemmobacter straminiformis]